MCGTIIRPLLLPVSEGDESLSCPQPFKRRVRNRHTRATPPRAVENTRAVELHQGQQVGADSHGKPGYIFGRTAFLPLFPIPKREADKVINDELVQQRNIIAFAVAAIFMIPGIAARMAAARIPLTCPQYLPTISAARRRIPTVHHREGQDKSIGWSPASGENQDFQAFAVGINQVNNTQILVNSLSVIQYIGGAQAVVK